MSGLKRVDGMERLDALSSFRGQPLPRAFSSPDFRRTGFSASESQNEMAVDCEGSTEEKMDLRLAENDRKLSSSYSTPNLGEIDREIQCLHYQFDDDGDVCAVYEKRDNQIPMPSRVSFDQPGTTDERAYNSIRMYSRNRILPKGLSRTQTYTNDDHFSQLETVRVGYDSVRGTCHICSRMNQLLFIDEYRRSACRLCQAYGADNRTVTARINPAFSNTDEECPPNTSNSLTPNWNLMQQSVKFSLETAGRPSPLERRLMSRNGRIASTLPMHKRSEWKSIKRVCLAVIVLILLAICAGLVITFIVLLE